MGRTRLAALAICVAVTAPIVGLGGGAAETAAASAGTPSRLLVTADEWSYVLSRGKLRRGPAIVELYNRGEDPHDLWIRRIGGGSTHRLGRRDPGQGGRLELRFRRASRYRLWCSLPNHRDRGMEAKLKISRKR